MQLRSTVLNIDVTPTPPRTISSEDIIGKHVEFTDQDRKYRIGKVKKISNYDAIIVLPDWRTSIIRNRETNEIIREKKTYEKIRVPKEFIISRITHGGKHQTIIWPKERRRKGSIEFNKQKYLHPILKKVRKKTNFTRH